MGLFLMNHPVAKIMVVGRLPRLYPTTGLGMDKPDERRNDSFFDASDDRRNSNDDPRT